MESLSILEEIAMMFGCILMTMPIAEVKAA